MKQYSKFNSKLYIFLFVAAALVSVLSLSIIQTSSVYAAPIRDFNPGRIIDDGVFYNKDSMNAQQIQSFLNRLIPNCDTWGRGASEYGGGTRAQYAASRGWPSPPYACLNNYHENPNTKETSFEKGGGAFTGGISAAQIIYNASQKYGINPQVLLVLLKKESAGPLTIDSWPLKSQYKYAMGYACPDSGPGFSANCSAEKSGFYNQVMLAAWQLKYYRDHPNDYRYGIGSNSIQYSPDPSCGTRHVNIENIATLSLYIYTPYVPNSGALANYPGTAPCGAYGNRNFFMFFKEWFGSTYNNSQIDILQADQDIKSKYISFKSQLGNATSDIVAEFNGTARVWITYDRGTIIWTPGYGAFPVTHGDIYNRWRELGGSAGGISTPTSDPIKEASDGRTWQEFIGGTIIQSPYTGAWEIVPGPIRDKWRANGGSTGKLGKPTSSVVVNETYRTQAFERGNIARKDTSSPAYTITSDVATTWNIHKKTLGAPNNEAFFESDDGRIWQQFEKGLVIDSGDTAYIIQKGPIDTAWRNLGGSLGRLGKPTSNQVTENDGRIWQQFEKGQLIQKNSKQQPHPVLFNEIYNRWRATGGSTGLLGAPIGSPYKETDGREWQDFEKGTVIWSQNTGAWEVQGGFYTFWKQKGGSTGLLGKPTSAKFISENDTRWQTFERGKAIWNPITDWKIELN